MRINEGDRVAFYSVHGRTKGQVVHVGVFGRVKVSADNGGTLFEVHEKQCRKIRVPQVTEVQGFDRRGDGFYLCVYPPIRIYKGMKLQEMKKKTESES